MFGGGQGRRVLALLFGVCIFCYFYLTGQINELEHFETPKQRVMKQYISPLCSCNKVIAVQNEEALNQSDTFHWCSLDADLRGDHQRVITYTLYGDVQSEHVFKRYYAQMRNLSMAVQKEYPGWVIRFYHSFKQRELEPLKPLCDIYCEFPHVDLCSVVEIFKSIDESNPPIESKILKGLNKKMYRFLVMLDPRVDVFMSRDIDSFILRREVAAVDQWLESNYTFHVLKDHKYHQDLILAGLWGAKSYQRRDLIDQLGRSMLSKGQNQKYDEDQTLLGSVLWPIAKHDVMVHDSLRCLREELYSPLKAHPFPTQRVNGFFVGGVGEQLLEEKCPVACRPPEHPDWEYC